MKFYMISPSHTLSLSLLSLCWPGFLLQPLSSTSCLFKDPATALVSILYVQTPWCRDIHSLFLVPTKEAGETKDYEMSFPEPFFYFVRHFFLSNWCFFPLSSSPSTSGTYSSIQLNVSFYHPHPRSLSHWVFFFFLNHHWFSRWNSDGGECRIMKTTPSSPLLSG